ncbi:phosphopantetheine-binding protein [Spirillospora sp. NPDC049652]|jgi:acyl carrier protein
MDDVRPRVREFLARYIRGWEVADDEDIFAAGHVNSLFIMQLVLFVENELGREVRDEDLVLANFSTVDAIAALAAGRPEAVGG